MHVQPAAVAMRRQLLVLTCWVWFGDGRRTQSSIEDAGAKPQQAVQRLLRGQRHAEVDEPNVRRIHAGVRTPLVSLSFLFLSVDRAVAFSSSFFGGITSLHRSAATRSLLSEFSLARHVPSMRMCAESAAAESLNLLKQAEGSDSDSVAPKAEDELRKTVKRQTTREELMLLARLTLPDWPRLICAFVALTFAATADALQPALQGAALNAALGLDSGSSGLRATLVRLGVANVASAAFTGIRGFLFWVCGARLVRRLRATLFSALLRQPQAFHDTQGPGELSTRLATDCVKLGDALSFNVNIMLRQLMQTIISVGLVMRLNMRLACLVLSSVALRSAFSAVYSRASRKLAQVEQDALAATSNVAEQCVSLIKVVRAHGNEAYEDLRYGNRLDRLLEIETRQATLYGFARVFNKGLDTAMNIGVLGLGGALVSQGLLPREMLTQFVLYSTYIAVASGDVVDQWIRFQSALGSATSVFDYLTPRTLRGEMSDSPTILKNSEPSHRKMTEERQGSTSTQKRGGLAFDTVDFVYPSRPEAQVLDRLSLEVKAGERVAIVGGSGSGKSTLFALALRFYQPIAGGLRLDGAALDDIDEETLRTSIAWVQQEPPLFADVTIRDNIAYGQPDTISDDQVESAAKEANAYEFIKELPDGFNTRLSAAGASLSGGQKQRVALARALVRDPALLLLDEATSALDPESERLVEEGIKLASERRTVIFTTHRVAQAKLADRIIVMSHGKIIEQGTHEELCRRKGAYAGLLRAGNALTEEEASAVVDLSAKE